MIASNSVAAGHWKNWAKKIHWLPYSKLPVVVVETVKAVTMIAHDADVAEEVAEEVAAAVAEAEAAEDVATDTNEKFKGSR
jgi:ArsR family metal-binding transcriptional regulator